MTQVSIYSEKRVTTVYDSNEIDTLLREALTARGLPAGAKVTIDLDTFGQLPELTVTVTETGYKEGE